MNVRQRDSRGIMHLGVLLALLQISVSQLIFGPSGSVVVLSFPDPTQRWFAGALFVGAVLGLVGAIVPLPRAYWPDAAGMLCCATSLTVYSLALKATIPSWNTALGCGFGFIAAAAALRLAVLAYLIAENYYPAQLARALRGIPTRFRR